MDTSQTPQPVILIIDDQAEIGWSLKRLAEPHFPHHQVLWVKDGLAGVEQARQCATYLHLVVLDIDMPLMDGNTTAVQIRRLAPQVPIIPFTSHEALLPAMVELGCVLPTLKRPDVMGQPMLERMRQAMTMPIAPLPETPLVAALQQGGESVLRFVQQSSLASVLATNQQTSANVQRALDLIERHCRRFGTSVSRELSQARKVLTQEVTG